MDVVLPWSPAVALVAVGLIAAAALLLLAARLVMKTSESVGLAVVLAAIAGGVLVRVVVDRLLDVAGFVLADTLSQRVGVAVAVLAARGAEAAVLLGAGLAAGLSGRRSPRWVWLPAAAVAAGASGLVGLPGSSAAAYAANQAQSTDWLVVFDMLGRHAAWASCLLGAVLGGAVWGRGGCRD